MGRLKNNGQSKGNEESSQRVLNEIEASQLSDIEFKAMVTRKLTELTRTTRNYRQTTMNSLQTIST